MKLDSMPIFQKIGVENVAVSVGSLGGVGHAGTRKYMRSQEKQLLSMHNWFYSPQENRE
jgi:hypothetical protein